MKIKFKIISITTVLLLFIGCTTVQQRTEDEGLVVDEGNVTIDPFYQLPSDSSTSSPQVSSTSSSRNETILALLNEAREHERAGRPERSAAVIERALRIDPKNAQLWYRLALLRLQQRQYDLAAGLAAKSKALARNDPQLQMKNKTLIKQSKILSGH
ncbi:MAG: tetratricopeptide repeat protein [Thiohalomonadales bacterium]